VLAERYRLERVLGDGGSATVFAGSDAVLQRPVAVKVFHIPADLTAQARRQREIHLASGFVHPNLVAVYDAHLTADAGLEPAPTGYLVCEYVDGQSLAQELAGGPLPADRVAEIGIGIALALAVLHAAEVVHRDVKPGNVLLENGTGRAKLSDLGIARDLGTDPVTGTSDVVGTAPYLSPEQARGEAVGCASDVYSLGLVLLECLTGRREYQGEAIPAAVARLLRDPAIPADLPGPWPTLLRRMTSRQPDQRPSADEVAVILAHRQPAAMAADPSQRGGPVPLGSTTRASTRRRSWLLAAAAGGALLITVGVSSGVAGRGPTADPPAASLPSSSPELISTPPELPGPGSPAPTLVAPGVGPTSGPPGPSPRAEPVTGSDVPQGTATEEPAAAAAGDARAEPPPADPPADPGPSPADPAPPPLTSAPAAASAAAPTAAAEDAAGTPQHIDAGATTNNGPAADGRHGADPKPQSGGNGNGNGNGNGHSNR